jgi:hypothetical protein
MSNNFDYSKWNNGDIVRVKSNRLVEHYAVFFIDEKGEKKFVHNTPTRGVCIDNHETFWIDREFISLHYSLISGISLADLLIRIKSIGEKKYNLFSYDCEDFVSELTGNRLKRKQILKYLTLATGIIFLTTGIIIYKVKK